MKKLVLSLAFLSVATLATAQKNQERKPRTEAEKAEMQAKRAEKQKEHLAKMKADLNLTDAQIEKIKANHAEMGELRKEEMLKNREIRKESAAKLKDKRQEMKDEMKSILTPDQYKKWEEQVAERKDKMKDNFKNRKKEAKARKVS